MCTMVHLRPLLLLLLLCSFASCELCTLISLSPRLVLVNLKFWQCLQMSAFWQDEIFSLFAGKQVMDDGGAFATKRCMEQDEHITNARGQLRTWIFTVRASGQGGGSRQDGGCVTPRYHISYIGRRLAGAVGSAFGKEQDARCGSCLY